MRTFIGTLLTLLFIAVSAGGLFAISVERQKKVDLARKISAHELRIKQLRRSCEELSVKITEQEHPSHLKLRAGARLLRPNVAGIIRAYENYDGGKVEFNGGEKGFVSFKIPEEKEAKVR